MPANISYGSGLYGDDDYGGLVPGMSIGNQRKAALVHGKSYSAVGTAASQTISAVPVWIGTIVLSGSSGTAVVFSDGSTQILAATSPAVIPYNVETVTNLLVTAPVAVTVSVSYD